MTSVRPVICLALVVGLAAPALAGQHPRRAVTAAAGTDHSGRVQHGRASFYGPGLAGRRMADGRPFRPNAPVAASRTLPLGTTAQVTNLDNGRSTKVRVEDRGPTNRSRVLDVSEGAAAELGMHRDGVAPVRIAPIEVPQPDGSVRAGAGAGR